MLTIDILITLVIVNFRKLDLSTFQVQFQTVYLHYIILVALHRVVE